MVYTFSVVRHKKDEYQRLKQADIRLSIYTQILESHYDGSKSLFSNTLYIKQLYKHLTI